jgi:hypothetical protein
MGAGCRVKYIYGGDPIRIVDPRDRFVVPVESVPRIYGGGRPPGRLSGGVAVTIETDTPGLFASVVDETGEPVARRTPLEGEDDPDLRAC